MTPSIPSEPARCTVCGSPGSRSFRARTDDASDPPFLVVRCLDCGFGWTDPSLPEAEVGRWYPPTYYGDRNVRFNFAIEALVRWFRRRRARYLRRFASRGPVLDVGCGRGFMLASLRSLGYEPHGVELSETAARHAREALHLDVRVGDFLALPPEERRYRCVIFWHSLEHVRRPLDAIGRAREILEPGGLLVIALPNSDSLQARLTNASWFHLDVPRHYVHFGTRSLVRALEERGFDVRAVSHFALEQNPYGWLQSLENALGLEWNLLYSLIKTKGARREAASRSVVQTILVLVLLPFLFPLACLLWLVELVLRRGGTIDVYAVKR
jgi:2-polyprenyl-3-methyl-5-hydroxy-6-metoxy-1,4-benzoquinol methylase